MAPADAAGGPAASVGLTGIERFSLGGKTAFICGASRGIGLAIATGLAACGAHVILGARSGDVLAERARTMRANGWEADWVRIDTTDHESVRSAVESLPPIDVLVNVVGTNVRKPFLSYSWEEYEQLLDINLNGIVDVTRHLGARMVARGAGGKILMIGSLVIHIGVPNVAVYAATKGALAALTRALAAEWAPYDIQVNCIVPGMILTELNEQMWQSTELREWLRGAQANPRLGRPEDLAPLAVFLSGPGSDYITGQLIAVDGGYTTTKMWPFRGDDSS